jgi:CRP/FNR family transcriptional regulator, cyclic AMP receptor protein
VLRKNAKVEMLRRVPLFATCSKRQLEDIATIADELAQPKGSTLARQGDRGHEFIVLVDGLADVRRNGRRIASLGPGSFFGEIALLTESARTADVVAATDVRTLVIGDRAFARLLREDAAVQAKLLGVLAARLAENAGTHV